MNLVAIKQKKLVLKQIQKWIFWRSKTPKIPQICELVFLALFGTENNATELNTTNEIAFGAAVAPSAKCGAGC
ncbi:MAG: hypothetical protein MR927_08295 [Campylobacter sp.]|nr:hypothetical protein [Campylobacter sp.]